MPKSAKRHVFDTVALSNFALAANLDLLVSRYGRRAVVTPEVLDEVADGIVAGYAGLHAIEEAVRRGQLTLGATPAKQPARETYRELLRVLAPGEASCIVYAKENGGVVVTDDRTARACCRDLNVTFTGTIGILKACCSDGFLALEEADKLLQAMVENGYYAPVQRISDLT
jgi:predicted nucleic acid-binding protein